MKKIDDAYFERLCEKFSLLYVGSKFFVESLGLNFKEIVTCKSQEEAIKIYKEQAIDIVFIDVDTKDIQWLPLVNALRKISYDASIAIVTDLSNTDRLTTAITVGITQCIFKPVDAKRLKLVVYDIVNKLQNKIDAKELFYKKEEEKINQIASQSAQEIIYGIPSPMFIFSEDKVLFTNKGLHQLFKNKNVDIKVEITLGDIEALFSNFEEQNSFKNIREGKSVDIKYNYEDNTLKRVYIPTKFSVNLEGIGECSVVYLYDIAPLLMQIRMMSYQQNKVDSYKTLIEKLLAKEIFKENKKAISGIVTPVSVKTDSIDTKLSDREVQILRKSVNNKINSVDFTNDLDESSYEEVHELYTIEEDLQIAIDNFEVTQAKADIFDIAKYFNIQGSVISSLIEFSDLGNAICSLSDFLFGLEESVIEANAKKMRVQLENILQDLIQWRENIFESKTAVDIHYLDSSIFSSVLQFQINLQIQDEQDDGDDLELF